MMRYVVLGTLLSAYVWWFNKSVLEIFRNYRDYDFGLWENVDDYDTSAWTKVFIILHTVVIGFGLIAGFILLCITYW